MKIQETPQYQEFGKLLEVICKSAAELLHASASSIYLKEGDEVFMHAAYGYSEDLIHMASYKIGEGITGWIAEGNELIATSRDEIINHKNYKGKYDPRIWKESKEQCYSFVGVPLFIGDKICGLVKIENKTEAGTACIFTDEDLERLKIFLFAISSAIQQNKDIMGAMGKLFVFVLMPFQDKYANVYDCIVQASEKADMICSRSDEEPIIGKISNRICDLIRRADIIVSLMTERNPNVFYETGFGHAIDKPTIHLAESADDIPFDLKDYGHIIYHSGKLKELRGELIKYFQYVRQSYI